MSVEPRVIAIVSDHFAYDKEKIKTVGEAIDFIDKAIADKGQQG